MSGWPTYGVIASELVSATCTIFLWRQRDHVLRKIVWTLILAIPGLGPLLYGGLYDLPSVQPEVERAPVTSNLDA